MSQTQDGCKNSWNSICRDRLSLFKIERAMDDGSGEKDRIFWIYNWFCISSDNLDNELGTMLQMLMMSWIWEGLQIFQKNIRAVLVAR